MNSKNESRDLCALWTSFLLRRIKQIGPSNFRSLRFVQISNDALICSHSPRSLSKVARVAQVIRTGTLCERITKPEFIQS